MPATRYRAPLSDEDLDDSATAQQGHKSRRLTDERGLYTWGVPSLKVAEKRPSEARPPLSWTECAEVLPGAVAAGTRKSASVPDHDLRRVPPHLRPDVPPALRVRSKLRNTTPTAVADEISVRDAHEAEAAQQQAARTRSSCSRASEGEWEELVRSLDEAATHARDGVESRSKMSEDAKVAAVASRESDENGNATGGEKEAVTTSSHSSGNWRKNREAIERWMGRYHTLLLVAGMVGLSSACLQHEAIMRGRPPTDVYVDALKGINELCALIMLVGLYRLYVLAELFARVYQVSPPLRHPPRCTLASAHPIITHRPPCP